MWICRPGRRWYEWKSYEMRAAGEAVQMTRAGEDVMGMEMTPDEEWVYILYRGGSKRVPVAMDSGIAFMRDILNHM